MKIHEDFLIKDILWYKIGGNVQYVLDVENKEDLQSAVSFIKEKGIKRVQVVATGANLIFPDDYFEGAVIHLKKPSIPSFHLLPMQRVEAFAGEILDSLLIFCFDHALIGFEWAGGLPGTVGAAVRGNVGAFGSEIKNSFVTAQLLRISDQEVITYSKEQMEFSYRQSFVKQHKEYIVISALFQLQKASAKELEDAKETYYANINYRKENHPHEFPNTGSVFKNINNPDEVAKVLEVFPDLQEKVEKKWHGKVSMGYLNRKLGFAGFQIGGARVSEQHCNFIDNVGNARAEDAIGVIRAIQEKFQEIFGFCPEAEVEIVDNVRV